MARYRAEVVFTFDATALTDGGRRLREWMSFAAESASRWSGLASVMPRLRGDLYGWTSYAPLGAGYEPR